MKYYIIDSDIDEYRSGYLTDDEPIFDVWSHSFIAKTFEAETLEEAQKVLCDYNHYSDRPVTMLHCCSTGCCVSTYSYYHDTYKCMMSD